ncbi:MAG: MotA/TolQ/ExbB proton channel family protein [Elusimicrobia bacterium]|nr:MotA/TolQ/ExbB proton channel family protein [Elusimicrobiota bacterium]
MLDLSLKQMIIAGGPVLFILIGLSIYSIALIWERWRKYKKTFSGMRLFIHKAHSLIKASNTKRIMELSAQHKSPYTDVINRVMNNFGSALEKRELAEKAIEWHVSKLSKSLTIIATIASISPFIGLLGTVIGIMRAFRDLAQYAGAGPSVIALGIAEALVNTAAGLFVAIPAIIAYNYFSGQLNKFSSDMNWITEQIITKLHIHEYYSRN